MSYVTVVTSYTAVYLMHLVWARKGLIVHYKITWKTAWVTTVNSEGTNTLTKAILGAIIFVSEHLIDQKAKLLPRVCRIFLQRYCGIQLAGSIKSVNLILEV